MGQLSRLVIVSLLFSVGCAKSKNDSEQKGKLSLHEVDRIDLSTSKDVQCRDVLTYQIGKSDILETYSAGECESSDYEKKYTITAAQHRTIATKVEDVSILDTRPACVGDGAAESVLSLQGKNGSKEYRTGSCVATASVIDEAGFVRVLEATLGITQAAVPK